MTKKQAPKATPKKQGPVPKAPVTKPVAKNTKQTSDDIASIGSKAMKKPESLTLKEIKKLGASVVSQSNPNDGK